MKAPTTFDELIERWPDVRISHPYAAIETLHGDLRRRINVASGAWQWDRDYMSESEIVKLIHRHLKRRNG